MNYRNTTKSVQMDGPQQTGCLGKDYMEIIGNHHLGYSRHGISLDNSKDLNWAISFYNLFDERESGSSQILCSYLMTRSGVRYDTKNLASTRRSSNHIRFLSYV